MMPTKRRQDLIEQDKGSSPIVGARGGKIILYNAPDGTAKLDVQLEHDTVWLSQQQMALLFDTERSVLSKHLTNIFHSGELDRTSNVQKMHIAGADRPVALYNLDVVISVGYRVNSKRGTQFRIWATNVLREHLLKGYTVNERRLQELNQAVRLVADVANRRELTGDEATALLHVVGEYSFALDLLDDYDYQRVVAPATGTTVIHALTYNEAVRIVQHLRGRFGGSELFGREKDNSLQSALGAVIQTWDGTDLYPGVEAKAANLLYLVVKNHAFFDGNKRIGAALFLWFLDKNNALYDASGERRFSDAALVATTLLIAESKPDEKDVIVHIVTNLLTERPKGTVS
ncbi:RhuM family protein [Candidatus Cryosericum odellii]|jgi:prophage maintenance system killer protein|nr:RhuM family protein [Candidatus Cryosericum odellii]